MKALGIILSLVTVSFAFAGPEDHTPGAVYITDEAVPYYVSEFVFDDVRVSPDGKNLEFFARYGNLQGQFPITEVTKWTEDKDLVTAQKVILDKWESGCGSGERATLTIKAKVDDQGINAQDLRISLVYMQTPDTCHSRPTVKTLKYHVKGQSAQYND